MQPLDIHEVCDRVDVQQIVVRERLITLFFAVLGLSATSWGGLALMAQLERRYVERKPLLTQEAFADLVAIAWAVPGPVACNVAVGLGYALRGSLGALVAGLASVIPFFIAMVALALAYLHHSLPAVLNPAVLPRFRVVLVCLIAVTLWRQSRSLLKKRPEQAIAAIATLLLWLEPAPAVFVGVLCGAFAFGWLTGPRRGRDARARLPSLARHEWAAFGFYAVALTVFALVPLDAVPSRTIDTLRQVGASLSLFGGGFSAFPILRSLFVGGAHGVSADTFNTAFTLSAIVPGPLLNVVPFLGQLCGGVSGAVLATMAFFAPTGALAVFAHRWLGILRQSPRFEHALGYSRAAATAFLADAVLRLLPNIPATSVDVLLAGASLFTLGKLKLPVYWLYLAVAVSSLVT
ncbi:chromate transporter [Paraburkholderia edwinii]|uniref:Chromate transporter n=1 Tax=Paraburkholderia edwinii TaxID=2861782 RepID=A0ABX8UMH3_9BURK|nr:chromate transporter [Paraburkholderia edwinii]QYD68199.1 chromate transporter [Paraburkholderia edwinii]